MKTKLQEVFKIISLLNSWKSFLLGLSLLEFLKIYFPASILNCEKDIIENETHALAPWN